MKSCLFLKYDFRLLRLVSSLSSSSSSRFKSMQHFLQQIPSAPMIISHCANNGVFSVDQPFLSPEVFERIWALSLKKNPDMLFSFYNTLSSKIHRTKLLHKGKYRKGKGTQWEMRNCYTFIIVIHVTCTSHWYWYEIW